MRLRKLELENVRGVPDGTYEFIRDTAKPPSTGSHAGTSADDRVTIVVGPRGTGKTSLLEAIVFAKECVGGYGPPGRPESMLRSGASSGRLHALFHLEQDEQQAAETETPDLAVTVDLRPGAAPIEVPRPARVLFARFSASDGDSKLEYFPDNRSLDDAGEATTIDDEKRLRPLRTSRKYAGLVASLEARSALDGARALKESADSGILFASDTPDSLTGYRAALSALCPEVHLVGVMPEGDTLRLMFALKSGALVAADRLSSGQKQGLLFAATIRRLGLARSLVLVDVPELGLQVSDHAAFTRALFALLPRAQLIAATGSGAVAGCVGRAQTIVLAPAGGAPGPSSGGG